VDYSAAILRNKGVQVDVAVLVPGDGDSPPSRLTTPDGEPKTEQRWVRFTANAIADIEDAFGNLSEFEAASRLTPFKAVRTALAAAWDVTPRVAGEMMLEGRISDYSTAVGVALALANGVDPQQAGRLLKIGVKASSKLTTERDRQLEEAIAEGEAELEDDEATTPTTPTTPETIPTGPSETAAEEAVDESLTTPASLSPGMTSSETSSEPDGTGTSSGG
jgi:hypothetical protein